MSNAPVQLVVAAFNAEGGAAEALKQIKAASKEQGAAFKAAVAIVKDQQGTLHYKDVGLTPGKGAVEGIVLGAALGILSGGVGLVLGGIGAVIGGVLGRKKQDSRFDSASLNQIAASLQPGNSALVAVVSPDAAASVSLGLENLGADVALLDISADVAAQLQAHESEAQAALDKISNQ